MFKRLSQRHRRSVEGIEKRLNMETAYHSHNYAEGGVSSEDEDNSSLDDDSSDECESAAGDRQNALPSRANAVAEVNTAQQMNVRPTNLVKLLFNRERAGYFSGNSRAGQYNECAFNKVPNRLSFCLKDIVDNRFLQGHVFMGLTGCGQFLLSYKVCCNDNIAANHYSFNVGYKYTLYFWVFQPHKPLRSYFQCCLFDDHGVDNVKVVTMTQWKNADTRVLIVHGAPVEDCDDSYITYVKVPKLGCLECKKQRESQEGVYFFFNTHCLNCNLTVHTKYASSDTDPKFEPHINLLCPERILIVANGFMHMLRIDLDTSTAGNVHIPALGQALTLQHCSAQTLMFAKIEEERRMESSLELEIGSGYSVDSDGNGQSNVVARIIADFSDIEAEQQNQRNHNNNNESQPQQKQREQNKTYEEIIFSNNASSSGSSKSCTNINSNATVDAGAGGGGSVNNGNTAASLKRKRFERIVTKSFRNGIVTIDLQGPTTSSAGVPATPDKSNAYEFSEDNEKCEKISTLRKRRLADKQYEFSEDNSENIIPFTKIRSAGKACSTQSPTPQFGTASSSGAHTSARSLHRFSPTAHYFHNTHSPCPSPSSSPHTANTQPSCSSVDARHYTSPPHVNLEFRSPPSCPSPASTSFMRSPNRQATTAQIYNQKSPPLSQATLQMLSFKPLGALSPLQVSMTKRLDLGGSMSPNASLSFLSPRREDQRIVEVPLQGATMPEKPICTKKLRRRYVEEDDATSVITSEEDDCISPGYHTSLPVEVHGSCYSEMQMVSQASYQRLRCTSVVITQHSFDLETFTYYVISVLCQKNQKTYDVFYDWAYEVINVCPLSQTVSCLLMAQFAARDQLPTSHTNCLNCSGNFDCAFHRRQFECRILFTWNMESGEWQVLDYGELKEIFDLFSPLKKCGHSPVTFAQQAKKVALEVSASLNKMPNYKCNLRVLGSDIRKSKQSISDLDNMVEFYLKRR